MGLNPYFAYILLYNQLLIKLKIIFIEMNKYKDKTTIIKNDEIEKR